MSNTNPDKVVKGEFLSETSYYKVEGKNHNSINGTSTRLVNQQGENLQITDGLVATTTYSASQYTEEEKVTATRLAELLTEVGDTVFSASFQKLPDAKVVTDAIDVLNKGKILSREEMGKHIKEAYKGEERIIIARLLSVETLMGRAKVVDLEQEFKNTAAQKANTEGHTQLVISSIRLIDLRNLNWLIYKGIKYTKKK